MVSKAASVLELQPGDMKNVLVKNFNYRAVTSSFQVWHKLLSSLLLEN